MDFFFDGVALEVKVSRRTHVHHVSQRQIDLPVGEHKAYLLSIWQLSLGPGLALVLLGVTFSLLGDGLADLFRAKQ